MLSTGCVVFATANLLTDSSTADVKNYAILPDRGYGIERIVADSTLLFVVNDSLKPQKHASCWIRIIINNPFPYQEKYNIWLFPYMNNTLYYFDPNSNTWKGQRAGIKASLPNRTQRLIARMPLVLRAGVANTLYIKVDISEMRQFGYPFKPEIQLRKQLFTDQREHNLWVGWVAALTVLSLFFLNNVYIYVTFKDKTVLYYLIAQLGGMIYITSYRYFFAPFMPIPVFSFWMGPDSMFEYYDLNSLLQHAGILLLMYLSTKEIAALLNVDPASVRRAKTRLYKKNDTVRTNVGMAKEGSKGWLNEG